MWQNQKQAKLHHIYKRKSAKVWKLLRKSRELRVKFAKKQEHHVLVSSSTDVPVMGIDGNKMQLSLTAII